MKHEDLFLVRLGDGPPGPRVRLILLVFAEQLLKVCDVGQNKKKALGSTGQQHQSQGDDAIQDAAHGSSPTAKTGVTGKAGLLRHSWALKSSERKQRAKEEEIVSIKSATALA